MKRVKLTAILFLALALAAAGLALAQEDNLIINSQALGEHTRPLVKFSHAKHSEKIADCTTCHHDFSPTGNRGSSEGQFCSDCHSAQPTAKNSVSLVMAFHKQCKECHRFAAGKGQPSGPVMCGGCHVAGAPTAKK
ncbi:MAG: cytochrome c family protein [Desulfarculus sp.]|nr:cytochrome c family protein [Desulfarculus sp.]